VPDERLAHHLAQGGSASRILETMAEEALARGGRDNLTGLLLALDDPGLALPEPFEPVRIVEPQLSTEPVPDPDFPAASSSTFSRLGRLLRGNT
jgi:protein phosphatase